MIANICTFMLYCFAITLNIKTIKSAGDQQINPIRFNYQTTPVNYINMINNVKTFRKHPTFIKPSYQRILSARNCANSLEYKAKLKSRGKLEQKAQDVKCTFCVIVKAKIQRLTGIVELLQGGEPFGDYEDTVKGLKQETELIVKLLLAENLETAKWLWSYFLKIIAVRRYRSNAQFIQGNPFEDDQLQAGVSDCIDRCVAHKYLPPAAAEADFLEKNISVYNAMFAEIRSSVYFANYVLDRDYGGMIDVLYLKPFWDDEQRPLLFRQISQTRVDWTRVKQLHETEVVVTREFLDDRIWIHEPYGRIDHQRLLIKIIDARFYCHLSVILHVYLQQLSTLDDLWTLNRAKSLIYNVINESLNLTAFRDEFLVHIASELQLATLADTNELQDILARVTASANRMLRDLNGEHTSQIDWLGFEVDASQLSVNVFTMRLITDFENYLNELKTVFLPFAYKTLLHFADVVKSPPA